MKIMKTASGHSKIKMSRKEWTAIGKKAGWLKKAQENSANKEWGKRIVQELENKFGGFSEVEQSGNFFKWELTDEALGTCYIEFVYQTNADEVYMSKIYENETLDESYGDNVKISNVHQDPEGNFQKVLSTISKYTGNRR